MPGVSLIRCANLSETICRYLNLNQRKGRATVDSVFEEVKKEAKQILSASAVVPGDFNLFLTKSRQFGELTTNVAFELASELREKPRNIAQRIVDEIGAWSAKYIMNVEVAGAGYINFYLDYDVYSSGVLKQILEAADQHGQEAPRSAHGQVIIEHTSVNPNKPWHIGHVRNAVLGDTLGRIFRWHGHEVEIQNYIDDTGRQVAEAIFALEYLNLLDNYDQLVKFDHFLGDAYVKLHHLIDENPTPDFKTSVESSVKNVMHELEAGKHRSSVEKCLDAQLETAYRLSVFYDVLVWESDIIRSHLLEEAISRIKASDQVYLAEVGPLAGCLAMRMEDFVDFSEKDDEYSSDKVLVRSNGIPTYTAKDIAFQMWKFGLLRSEMKYDDSYAIQPNGSRLSTTHPDGASRGRSQAQSVINVIGYEQEYPQLVVRAALKLTGFDKEFENSKHLSYGHVRLPEGRMSGRKGTVFSADEVIKVVVAEARKIVEQKQGDLLTPEQKDHIAEGVGIGAIRFAMLQNKPESLMTFKLDDALNFSGYTSLYLQYSYARIHSILMRYGENSLETNDSSGSGYGELLSTDEEKELILRLSLLSMAVAEALEELNPSVICKYGYEVAIAFGKFYEKCSILNVSNEELKLARVALTQCTGTVLRAVLDLLGIPLLEKL